VRLALGDTTLPRPSFATDPTLEGVGVARRVSATRNIEYLYVAVQVANSQNEIVGVLRLAITLRQIQAYNRDTVRFIRNATAVAVSAAIGFSLIAAVVFVRPLQRVRAMVAALTNGDMGAKVAQPGNDEVGDIGRALNHMATALRRKLLDAGLGEALISQLVETLPCPCVVYLEGGEVVAINGHGRQALRIEGPLAGQHMREFAEHPAVHAAVQTAEQEGEPEPLSVTLSDGVVASGFLHVLKRPGTAPLRVYFGNELPRPVTAILPEPGCIAPLALAEILERAAARYITERAGRTPSLELPRPAPGMLIAEADDRVVDAVHTTLTACASELPSDSPPLHVILLEEKTRVGLHISHPVPEQASAQVRPLIEPLGGSLQESAQETTLWLPRA
jgi:HAMP domain-containing protein